MSEAFAPNEQISRVPTQVETQPQTPVRAATPPSIPRNSGIDMLRGMSILLVVIHHIGLRIRLNDTDLAAFVPRRVLSALNWNGYEAVFVFFVISGFLITGHALRRWGDLASIDARAFYVRRFARIVPSLAALVIVLSVLHLIGFDDYLINHERQSLPQAIFSAFALHLNWYEGHTGYLPGNWDVLWSLSIEEVFYLGFPLVCLLARRAWILIPMLIVLALSLPFTHAALAGNEIWQEKAYLPGIAAIAMGVLAALLAARVNAPRRSTATLLCVAGGIGIAGILLFEDLLWDVMQDGCLLLLTASAASLLIGLHWRERLGLSRPLRGFGWLRSFGQLSYEVYLTHMFVVFAAVRVWKEFGSDKPLGWIWFVPVIALCWLLGWIVARVYSTPSDRLLRKRLLARLPLPVRARVKVAEPSETSIQHE